MSQAFSGAATMLCAAAMATRAARADDTWLVASNAVEQPAQEQMGIRDAMAPKILHRHAQSWHAGPEPR